MKSLYGIFRVSRCRKIARTLRAGLALGKIGLAAGLLLSCQATAHSPVGSRDNNEVEANKVPKPPAESLGGGSVPDSEYRHPTDTPRALPRFQLKLPESKAFVNQSLPPAQPERYKRWRETYRLLVNQGYLYVAASLGAGRNLLVKSDDEATVRVYEKKSKKLVGNYPLGQTQFDGTPVLPWIPAHSSTVENEDSFLLGTKQGLSLHDATTGHLQKQLSAESFDLLSWSADGQILGARVRIKGNGGSDLVFFQRTGPDQISALGRLNFGERVDAWDLSRDNRLLALSYYPSKTVEVIDLHEDITLIQLVGPNYAGSLSFSPDGRALAIGGQGLLLVDLASPQRRAYYSYFGNNINSVRFSPSGDAIATSSYDGRIRLFTYALSPASLNLIQTLRHTGTANVYSIEFSPDGSELMSASGDQSVRRFGAPPSSPASSHSQASFHTLAEWRTLLPAEEQKEPPVIVPSMKDGHYWPPSLDAEARPSRIKPGKYACKITSLYRLRDCTVTLNEQGHSLLEFAGDNLFGLKGVLYDDGAVTRYEAWLTEPSSLYDCEGCEKQPIQGVFRGSGNTFSGLLLLRNVYDDRSAPPVPAGDIKFEEANDRMPLSLQYRGPLPASAAAN